VQRKLEITQEDFSRSLSVQHEKVTTASFKITLNYPLSIVLSFTPLYADSSPTTNSAIRIHSWQISCGFWRPDVLFLILHENKSDFSAFCTWGHIGTVHGPLKLWVCYIINNCSKSKRRHGWQHSWLPTNTHIQNTRPNLGLYTHKKFTSPLSFIHIQTQSVLYSRSVICTSATMWWVL